MAMWRILLVALGAAALWKLWRMWRRWLRVSCEGAAVIVTGCDSGLGFAIAQRLAREKAVVFASCLTSGGIEKCKALGKNVVAVQVDITSDDDVARFEKTVRDELKTRGKSLMGLVNNAGIGNYGFAEALDLSRYKAVLDVNCLGTVRVTKAFLPMLRETGRGARLVTIGSISDRIPAGFGSAYVPSKAYVCWFTESVGFEMHRFGLRASVVEPGFIATELLDSGQEGGANACASADAQVRAAYGEFMPMMLKMREPVMLAERINGGKVGGPAWVAESTLDALTSSWPRSRYLCGWEASLLSLFVRIPGWQRVLGNAFEAQHRAVHI